MSSGLPSLEAPPAGTVCPFCGDEMPLVDFCGACADRFGDDDHGIDTARLVAEVRRLRALIVVSMTNPYAPVGETEIEVEARAILEGER